MQTPTPSPERPAGAWQPIALAILVPLVLASVYQMSAVWRETNPTPSVASEVQRDSSIGYMTITLTSSKGTPLAERALIVDAPENQPNPIRVLTDSAGIATLSITRKGKVTITLEGTTTKTEIADLNAGTGDIIPVTLPID